MAYVYIIVTDILHILILNVKNTIVLPVGEIKLLFMLKREGKLYRKQPMIPCVDHNLYFKQNMFKRYSLESQLVSFSFVSYI